jgi:hypothetical protein
MSRTLSKRLFVNHIRHTGGFTAVIALQYVDQSPDAAARHAPVRIRGKPRHLCSTGEVGEQADPILDLRVAQRRIRRQWLTFEHVKRRAGDYACPDAA